MENQRRLKSISTSNTSNLQPTKNGGLISDAYLSKELVGVSKTNHLPSLRRDTNLSQLESNKSVLLLTSRQPEFDYEDEPQPPIVQQVSKNNIPDQNYLSRSILLEK